MTEATELEVISQDDTPVFLGESYEDHVNAWLKVDRSIADHYWALGNIADSLESKHGDSKLESFADDVGCTVQRVRQYRKTYRAWENEKRFSFLSFHHHTIAARSADPQKALEQAREEGWSTRELEDVVKAEKPKGSAKYKPKKPPEVKDVEEDSQSETMVLCPCCEGHGAVPKRSSKSIAKAIKGLTIFGKGR